MILSSISFLFSWVFFNTALSKFTETPFLILRFSEIFSKMAFLKLISPFVISIITGIPELNFENVKSK